MNLSRFSGKGFDFSLLYIIKKARNADEAPNTET